MDGREDLHKVSIETEQDWRRIQQNLSTALLARLDRELAHEQSGDEGALLPHIHQFLESLLEIARPKVRINECTTEVPCDGEDELEFDEALDRHIWSLSDQRLKWHKEIAGYRRTRPEEIERALLKSLARHHMSDMDVAEDPSTYHELMLNLSKPYRVQYPSRRSWCSQLPLSTSGQPRSNQFQLKSKPSNPKIPCADARIAITEFSNTSHGGAAK